MNQFILVLILTIIVSSETVDPTINQCTCSMILSQADCLTVSVCAWTAAIPATSTTVAIVGSCESSIILTPTIAVAHCPSVTEPAINCWKTIGCAYVDNKCTHFTGCTAYVKITNSDCQAISSLCTTDGSQCTDAKSCNEYIEEVQCTGNASISGTKTCKWDNNACRDYLCTEANTTLATNADCNSWLQGCVTTGKGCTLTLGACASYAGDEVTCSGLKGTDGNCEGTVGGTNCITRVCSKAMATVVTDIDCQAYQVGCITNGKGCVTSPLPACATYLGDNITCLGYIGSDGICEGDSGATNCRSRVCTNAPASNDTNDLCNAFKVGCVTTGKGCATSKTACSGYSGTTITCIGYIGTDGYCKGTNLLLSSPCAAKVCSDAPTTASTDADCILYQLGCKSTGKGCVATLGLCSSYSGTNTACGGFIGSDGKCKGTLTIITTCNGSLSLDGTCIGTLTDTVGSCSPKLCTEAPISTTTNEACALYQFGCVTTGSGCVAPTDCLATIKSLACTGTVGCGWNSICVASQNCSDFQTISICNGNNAILVSGGTSITTACFWTGSACRNLACTDAPSTINSDSLCNNFLSGCWTKGDGCLAPTTSCLSYKGTRTICSTFTRRCYNVVSATTSTTCTERVCADDSTSTTDFDCNSFKTGCLTKGTGCIDPSKLCSDYSGIQQICDAFRGNNGLTRCWSLSTTVSSACIDKTCAHKVTATSNSDCDAFLSGCLFNGVGCVTKSQPCSAYTGTQSQCNLYRANNGVDTCWNTSTTVSGSCVVKNCGHAGALTSDTDCKIFLESCLTTGSGCISKTNGCSAYTGTLAQCEAFTGNSIKCYKKDICTDRLCTDKASGVANNVECTTYLGSCRYFNGGCVTQNICTGYPGNTLANCQDVFDNSSTPQKCWWITGGTTCIARTCANAPTVSNQQGCTDYSISCVFNGSICLNQGICASYTAFGVDTPTKQTNCRAMMSTTGTYCWNSGGTNCEDIKCSNEVTPTSQLSCDNHIAGLVNCKWNGTTCVNTTICSEYIPTGANDSTKLSNCQDLNDLSSPSVKCYFVSGASNCVSKSCSNVPSPSSQSSCDSHLPGKCSWNGTACVILAGCASYIPSGASDSAKITICQALLNNDPTPRKCTFLSGGTTCIERTCDNVVSPLSSNDCYQWIDKCQWNGRFCETTPPCSAYSLTGVKNGTKTSICEKQEDSPSTPLFCTQRAFAVATTCVVVSCTTIQNPQTLSDCTAFSTNCRWSGMGTCIESATCPSYNVAVVTGIVQCAALTDSTGMQCKYITGTACSNASCIDKQNATSKEDCFAQGLSCRYIGVGTCAQSAAACAYTISASDKTTICNNVTDNGNPPQKCNYLSGASACSPRSTCISYTGSSDAICNLMYDTEGKQCKYVSGTTCDSYECYEKTDAIKAVDCTNYGVKCRYLGTGICSEWGLCTSYNVTSLNGPSVCNNLKDNSGTPKQCTYIQGTTCSVAVTCDSYAGLNNTTGPILCPNVVNVEQGRCKFAFGGFICISAICSDITGATNIQDCAGCRYVGASTCAPAGDCTSYIVSGTDYSKYQICNTLTDAYDKLCTWVTTSAGNCVPRDCNNKISPNSNASCIAWLSSCSYTGHACIATAACAGYLPVGIDNVSKRVHCSGIYDNSLPPVQCSYTDDASICVSRSCVTGGVLTNYSACNKWLNTCTFNGTNCVVGVGCNTYTQASLAAATINFTEQDKCRALKDNSNNGCLLDIPRCDVRTCENITPFPTNSFDCTNWLSTCRFTGNICVTASACDYTLSGDYSFVGKSDDEKIALCNGLEDNTNSTPKIYCTLINPIASGTVCIPRTCSNVNPTPISQNNCTNWLSNCTYNGSTCVAPSTCASYTSTGIDDATRGTQCRSWKNASGDLCGFVTGTNQTNCIDRVCSNAPSPSSDYDCSTYKTNCTISYAPTAICLESTSACTIFFGLPAQCQSFTGNNVKCWSTSGASSTAPQACKVKECTDDTTSTTNDQCTTFLQGCKTNGMGCVPNINNCSTLQGNPSTCQLFKASDGISYCKIGASSTDPCIEKVCSEDASSTLDSQCNSFIPGCLTNGKGCIASTEPCTKYQGTQSTCAGYTGNGKKCWNPSQVTIVTTYCVDKKCSDDTVSTTDIACNSSLTGCVTKGTGCIEKTAACGSYLGTQPICSAFFGNSGTQLCWNVVSASLTTPCIQKACIHNTTSTSDIDCETFLPRAAGATIPLCVTNGTGCVDYPRTCSQYTGTLEQCGKFTASDGPCKTTATGSISASGTCTPRICSEALNSNNTDTLCHTFHPTCVTTGFGCASSVGCATVQEQNSCAAKTGCSWVQNCRSIGTDCSSLTSSLASICVNTPVSTGSKKCSWYNGTTCRAQTCEDLPATLISHASCFGVLSTCTTTGSGCITMTSCSAYASEIICKSARTTDIGDTCIWNTSACRAKQCTDAPTGTNTDVGCNSYLTGCKTNGASCMENVTCPALLSASACQVDGNGNPCLFVNGLCNSFSKCEDILMSTHSACQIFSPLCTTNGQNCIAITTCAKTINLISCVVGTDGTCGWLPANGAILAQCQSFGACSDAIAIDMASCSAYGSNCITDGTKCTEKNTCSTYLTQIACETNGTDGACQFISSSSSCRLRECTDATAINASGGITTHSGCFAFTAKDKCTTNGTSCIAFQTCVSNIIGTGCFEGTDGKCTFALPVGQSTGTLACRLKVCEDFILATSALCSVALTGAGLGTGCVSNGTNCIVRALCNSYTSKEACNGGGSNGGCAFTPASIATPNVGTCEVMSACADANNDAFACNSNSSACNWQTSIQSTVVITRCSVHTCSSRAIGSTCQPVPNLDLKTYTICGPALGGGCEEVGGITLLAGTCQQYSLQTFTWDDTTQQCLACFASAEINSTSLFIGNSSTYGNIINSIASLVILAILVI